MRRRVLGGRVAYREWRWGWSLIFFLVFPVWLIIIEESLARSDGKATIVSTAGAVASVIAAFVLLRQDAFLIDRTAGILAYSHSRWLWRQRRTIPLSRVKSVRLNTELVEHALPPGGRGADWIETVHRISLDIDKTRVPFQDGISGAVGKRLAYQLAEDLGVRVRQ